MATCNATPSAPFDLVWTVKAINYGVHVLIRANSDLRGRHSYQSFRGNRLKQLSKGTLAKRFQYLLGLFVEHCQWIETPLLNFQKARLWVRH